MKVRHIATVALAMTCCCGTVQGGLWDAIKSKLTPEKEQNSPTIKVLVARDINGCMLEVHGRYNIFDPNTGERLATRFVPKSNFIQPIPQGVKWGEQFPGVYQLHVVPDGRETTISLNGIEYRGAVYVYNVEGGLNIVNEVLVEDYVHSILAARTEPSMPAEALAALAIAARSDACYLATHGSNPYYDVIADEVGYGGHAITTPGSSAARAMASTKNLVLSRQRAVEGGIRPLMTACFPGVVDSMESRWDVDQVSQKAAQGINAAAILSELYPEATIELVRGGESILSEPEMVDHSNGESGEHSR